MTLYMRVTNDEYELPVAIAETKKDLSRMLGLNDSAVSKVMQYKSPLYVAVEVDNDEE